MNPHVLKELGMHVTRAVMTRTVRQKQRSGILYNATMLRRALKLDPLPEPELTVSRFGDMAVVAPEDLEDALIESFSRYGEGETILITRSNRRAVDFNLAIRRVIYDREEVLVKGERLLVSKIIIIGRVGRWWRKGVLRMKAERPRWSLWPTVNQQ